MNGRENWVNVEVVGNIMLNVPLKRNVRIRTEFIRLMIAKSRELLWLW